MKITVIYQYYQATNAPGLSLIYDWTQHLAEQGHEVTVITGETGYMQCNSSKKPWYKRLIHRECIDKVQVCRTFTYSQLHRSYLSRLLGFLSFSVSSALALLFSKKPDLVIGSSPPIFPIFATWLVSKMRRIPFMLEVRDLWPESAVQMGILKSKPLIKIMTWMEEILYSEARSIIALTAGIQKHICDRGWPKEKVFLIPCGVDTEKLYPDSIAGLEIRKKFHLEHKKIILYFGAMGEANNIPVILRAAKRLQAEEHIIFMLVGDGMQFKNIQKNIEEMQLSNLILHPAVPKDQAQYFINAADICLVTLLDIPLFQGALPTKLFDYMACGKPVLCGVSGEAKQLLDEAQAGQTFKPNDDEQLSHLIIDILENLEHASQSASNSVEFIKNNYSANKMKQMIAGLVTSGTN